MATVSPSPQQIAPETQQRIYSPLHKLRGTIRRYIAWESLALCIMFLGAWFWLGLALDYGAFKLAGVDWVQVLPRWLRWTLLGATAGAFVVVMALALMRLLREFRPESLALVLERRFPQLLGDKLITAVELSDLDRAETYGYSRAMIIENVRDVSRRVDQVPVREVFNWRRLYRRWLNVALLTVGFMVLVTLVFLAWRRTTDVGDFGYRFADVSGIWFERNVLMHDTLWPRRSMIEIVEFPDSGELRIGRDAPSPRIKARALKWVVADGNAPEGWRAMTWADLKPEFLDGRPAPNLPTSLLVAPADALSAPPATSSVWTLDRVELLLEQEDVRKRLQASGPGDEEEQALRGVYGVLEKKAELAAMSRKLRKLIVPKEVRIYYWGAKTSDEAPMSGQQQGVHEYSAILSDLKESVKFYVKGEDYATYPYRRITLVPPPTLTKLEKDEYLPAYQYHRLPADGGADDLKGKKQARLGQGVSLTGGTSRIEIASGSDLVLRGEVDKDLSEARIRYRTAAAKTTDAASAVGGAADVGKVESLEIGADRRNIRKEFTHIIQPIEFDFEFTDTDNVKSLRHIVIQPIEDKTPDVNVQVETIRRTPSGYMCTPQAMIPFSGTIRDDVGLGKVEYAITYSRMESVQALAMRAAIAAGVMGGVSGTPTSPEILTAPGLVDFLGKLSESRQAVVTLPPMPLQSFAEIVADKDREFRYGKEKLPELLRDAPPSLDEWRRQRMIAQYDLKPNLEFLDLQDRVKEFQSGLEETIRPRYRMRLTILATDNNIETGPRVGQNKETFTFVVVPYEELLAEMNKDEEALAYKAQELSDKMHEVRNEIDKVVERMPRETGSDEFRASVSRMDEMLGELEKGSDLARELLSDSTRLLKEAQTNRLPQNFLETKQKLVDLLDEAIRVQFERAKDAHAAFRDALQARRPPDQAIIENSRQRQDDLIRQIDQALELVRKAIDITRLANNLAKVIEDQVNIEAWIKAVLQDEQDKTYAELGQLSPKNQPIELGRGERKVVTIDLGRDEFIPGRLDLKLQVPQDSELTVASTIQVPRLTKTIQLEIAAGNKTGAFTIPVTATPAGSKKELRIKDNLPFVLKVVVK